ncbi:MAG: B12-binding domain-containing radical SAM protein [Syntrophorhabdaceae bacterium]|nr:B12-binding domain-containing radical SAM protein [Syntrophorhabdaceae bacterium]
MKILLINAPSRRYSIVPPLGLLQVGSILESLGYKTILYDPLVYDPGLEKDGFDYIENIVNEFCPDIIGYSGIATSYGSVKKISNIIRSKKPHIIQIAGGPLSSVYNLLLNQAKIDIVVHGEAEVSLPELMNKIEKGLSVENVPGISFINGNGEIKRNNLAEQVKDLDSIPLPAYHLIDLYRYVRHFKDSLALSAKNNNTSNELNEILNKIGDDDRWIEIVTGRGCTHRCLFCYRHMKGIRYYSADYVIKHIKFLNDTYGIRGFQFADELFNGDKDRVYDICDAIQASGLDIFFIVGGARVDKIDKDMITKLKGAGCIEINYGQESGSDKILKEYRKGVTASQNKEITKLTMDMGINCPVQIVIGSPGETRETINETINFLKDVNAYQYSLNYLIPLPETPIWKYVEEKRLINDVEQYLDKVAEYGGQPLINLTAVSDKAWKRWRLEIRKELRLDYLKKTKRYGRYSVEHILFFVSILIYPYISKRVYDKFKVLLKKLIF